MRILVRVATWTWGLALAAALAGCGPEDPSVRYRGDTLPPKAVEKVGVFRSTPPERPVSELGMIDVSCPLFHAVEGGCTLEQAVDIAVARAAEVGADAIADLRTAAGPNGSIVSLTATALRYTGPRKISDKPAAVAPKGTIEERLKRLQDLEDKELITPEEHAKRKAEILKEL
jgi:hypothetical protein